MPRISTLSNPTDVFDIEHGRINVILDESGSRAAFSLAKLDLVGTPLSPELQVVVVARRGNAEMRVELGSAREWNRRFVDIGELGTDGVLRFRVLLVKRGDPKLIATAENVRAHGLGDGESFIGIETADLGQRPWDIVTLEQEGRAVVQINKRIYRSSAEAEADKYFIPMVIPEAVRRLAAWHTANPGALDDSQWEPFKSWLVAHGIVDAPEEDDSPDTSEKWCGEVVSAFCNRWCFAEKLGDARAKGTDE